MVTDHDARSHDEEVYQVRPRWGRHHYMLWLWALRLLPAAAAEGVSVLALELWATDLGAPVARGIELLESFFRGPAVGRRLTSDTRQIFTARAPGSGDGAGRGVPHSPFRQPSICCRSGVFSHPRTCRKPLTLHARAYRCEPYIFSVNFDRRMNYLQAPGSFFSSTVARAYRVTTIHRSIVP